MTILADPAILLDVALAEARAGLAEGGIPIGAALFAVDGTLLGCGRNRRMQDGDPPMHAETAAFRAAGRRRDYRDTIMVTTLSLCWYCSGLVRQFGIGAVLVGEARTFHGGHDWLTEHGVRVTVLDDERGGCGGREGVSAAVRAAMWVSPAYPWRREVSVVAVCRAGSVRARTRASSAVFQRSVSGGQGGQLLGAGETKFHCGPVDSRGPCAPWRWRISALQRGARCRSSPRAAPACGTERLEGALPAGGGGLRRSGDWIRGTGGQARLWTSGCRGQTRLDLIEEDQT